MNIIITFCLVAVFLVVIIVFANFIRLKGIKKLRYLKNFKKGKAFIVYLLALPILWLGLQYGNNKGIFDNFFNAVKAMLDLIALRFDTTNFWKLMQANQYYKITIYSFYIIVLINSIVFALSFFGQMAINWIRFIVARYSKRDLNIIIEYNKNNVSIMKSLKNQLVVFYGDLKEEEKEELFSLGVIYRNLSNNKELKKIVKENFKNLSKRKTSVFINTNDDSENLLFTKQFVDIIVELNLKENIKCKDREDIIRNKMDIYTFGLPTNESAFLQFAEKSHGCVHHLNKYKLIATDFIDRYPLTKFMNENELDYSSGTVKIEYNEKGHVTKDVDINMVIIGFGKTNQQLFLSSVANDQFITKDFNGNIIPKPVNYYFVDCECGKESNKILNHTFNRYVNEYRRIKDNSLEDKYLELPDIPANIYPINLNIEKNDFYSSLQDIIQDVKDNENKIEIHKFNYILISFGSDLENLDLAEKLLQKIKEWNVKNTTKIFIKIRNSSIVHNVINPERLKNHDYYIYSGEEEVVYNASKIVNEKIEKMAKMRNELYKVEEYAKKTSYDMNKEELESISQIALHEWYDRSEIERNSNIYACLGIRSKLNMFNFDYVKKEDPRKGVTREDFDKVYQVGFPKVELLFNRGEFQKYLVRYDSLNFVPSLRTNLAIQEHQRWNAFMISSGMIPSSIEEIKKSPTHGKDYNLRKHYITTNKGLEEFRKIKVMKNNSTELEEDVIKYDYQILDDVYWLLEKNGYKIIRLHELNENE